MTEDVQAGDYVEHRESGQRGRVAGRLKVGADWPASGDEPQERPMAWVHWDGEDERTAVPVSDLVKRPQP